jgi:hypothetical protein
VIPASEEVRRYLEGVTGSVEATDYEKHCLWLRYSKDGQKYGGFDEFRFDWQDAGMGYGPQVGEIGGKPVSISIMTATVAGQKLLFWYAMSVAADHDLIEKWLKATLPPSAIRPDGYLNRTEPQNFINIIKNLP